MSLRWPASRLLSVSDMSGWMEGTKFPNHATSSSSIEVGFIWSFPWSSAAIPVINMLYVVCYFTLLLITSILLSIIASKNKLPITVTLFEHSLERPSRSLQSRSKYWEHWPNNLKTKLLFNYIFSLNQSLHTGVLQLLRCNLHKIHWPLAHPSSWGRRHPERDICLEQQLQHEVMRSTLSSALCLTEEKKLLQCSTPYVSISATHQNINNKITAAGQGIKRGCNREQRLW